jgi:hypothetical protein
MGRRDFLRGAAVLAGSLALGWKSTAEAMACDRSAGASLVFWNGSRIAHPARIAASADALIRTGARVTIHGHAVPAGQTSSLLRGINAHYSVEHENSKISVPFYAWTASCHTNQKTAFTMPIEADHGLRLSVEHAAKDAPEEHFFLSAARRPGSASLRPGTYVLAVGQPNWVGCHLIEEDGRRKLVRTALGATQPVDFEYVLITISEA